MRKLLVVAALVAACTALPAAAAAPSKASLERLFVVTQVQKLSESMLQQMNAMLRPTFEQALAKNDMKPEQRRDAQAYMAEFSRKMEPILAEELSWERMKDMQMQIYSESFSQEEIDGLIAFYESPTGRAFVEKMPVVMQKAMGIMQQRMGPLMQRIGQAAQQTVEEMKAKSGPAPAKKTGA